jgi:hypothetical protein
MFFVSPGVRILRVHPRRSRAIAHACYGVVSYIRHFLVWLRANGYRRLPAEVL